MTNVGTQHHSDERVEDQATSGPELRVEHLTKRYGANTVVDDLTFTVKPGRVTGFLGPNGSGKSTTMKILLDLASSDAGQATIGGVRYRDLPDPAGTVGALLESNVFHPGRSGRNHLRILAFARGIKADRIDYVLDLVGLGAAADRRVGAYSLGMRQRLGFAAALLGAPPVLVLDEPANGLDPQGIRTMRDLLRARAARGDTVLVSSHLLGEVEHLADDLIVLNEGRLVTSGAMDDLRQTTTLVRTDANDALAAVIETNGGTVQRGDEELIVHGMSIDEVGDHAFRSGIAVHELSPHTGSLEERFLEWTRPAAQSASSHTEVAHQ